MGEEESNGFGSVGELKKRKFIVKQTVPFCNLEQRGKQGIGIPERKGDTGAREKLEL